MILPVLPLAHGLGQRENLPIPEDVFIITAAIVLAVSFVALAVLLVVPAIEAGTLPRSAGNVVAGRV